MQDYDVIVVGGGHAGTEAAAAAARRGARTALVSFDPAKIGAMSCNPAIGGLGKGHLVREVDAFDGLIARATDAAGIHYRMLNRSKGTAVQGPRVQADRKRYAAAIQGMIVEQASLEVVVGEAEALLIEQGGVAGVTFADGTRLTAPAVVLATGTFLGGRIFCGDQRGEGGRIGERAATQLGVQLRALDLPLARLKTGTPPRLDGRTIDWAALERQPSDDEAWTMSPVTGARMLPQLFCAVARTTQATHMIVRESMSRSPLYTGAISAGGPRYCPSIEDKITRFGDRDGHQIFLEPEGLDDWIVYPNGISTSLPPEVQQAMVRSIPGLEQVAIVTPGYAVEYDYIDPRSLDRGLQSRALPGLFCAGQLNGTTGYEEAAGQGVIAGLSAAGHALGLAPVLLDRASSYLGVMIDDLILHGVTEPYRMLTARAEYRLHLRADNAETRLAPVATAAGCVSPERLARFEQRARQRATVGTMLEAPVTTAVLRERGVSVVSDGSVRSGSEWLRFPGVRIAEVAPDTVDIGDDMLLAEIAEDARYAPYVERQRAEIEQLRREEAMPLPATIDYGSVAGLSNEMVERLSAAGPSSLAAASRIRGITPAALSAILLHVRRAA